MADALGLCLKKLLSDFKQYNPSYGEEAAYSKRVIADSYDGLVNHLRDMMAGYQNEEVQSLLNDMEGLVASEDSYRHEEIETKEMILYTFANAEAKLRERGLVEYYHSSWNWLETKVVSICETLCNIRYGSNLEAEEVVVGFDDEVETLLHQLTGTCTKQLQVLSIAGMAGLGKTTLAKKLYRDPLIEYMFDIRAWTCVSQVYVKKDLLLGILCSFIHDLIDEFYEMSEQQLGENLYRKLKGRKYFVVLDDIWDCRAWNDLKMYFPDDKTGSRVLFTSRDIEMSSHIQGALPALVLRLRTQDESWDIFLKNLFRTGICPLQLEVFGSVITEKCEGLPLAIAIAAGLLKNNWSNDWWMEIAKSLSSFMVSNPSQYMESLTLSYNHLPFHLRPCFLFFGAFPEDFVIPTTKLIWLWIAHGFIDETGSRILEDVAEDFLMNLIKRSLVMAPRRGADGQVKTCRIHDLLRDFSLRKAEEENFLPNIYRYGKVSSMFCSPLEVGEILQEGRSIPSDTYKFLKILDVESIPISSFPSDAVHLVNLRYLAIQAHDGSPHPSISDLVNLQVLIISSRKNVVIPKTIWSMVYLRHLFIKSGENLMEYGDIEEPHIGCPNGLSSLQTLSLISPQSRPNIFSMVPNLRKLGFCGPLISKLGDLEFPNLDYLPRLQKLKLLNTKCFKVTKSCNPIMFPEKLKKLTLSYTGIAWEEIWTFSWLPNLEVLKLKLHACVGERWETGDVEFRKLKILKIYDLDIGQWVSSRDNFPRLQRLVIHRCLKLESISPDLGSILTLEVIEVSGCRASAHDSALKIKKQQEEEGNFFLKVHAKKNSTIRKSKSARESLFLNSMHCLD